VRWCGGYLRQVFHAHQFAFNGWWRAIYKYLPYGIVEFGSTDALLATVVNLQSFFYYFNRRCPVRLI
jgi:hypothetical protein